MPGELPAWMGKRGRRNNQRSKRMEEKHAERTGGQRQAGSGSSWRRPQDVIGPEFLDQHKFTDSGSFRITEREWRKLRADAHRAGREPRFVIEFPAEFDGLVLYVTEP